LLAPDAEAGGGQIRRQAALTAIRRMKNRVKTKTDFQFANVANKLFRK
jgi:hypothetical protein